MQSREQSIAQRLPRELEKGCQLVEAKRVMTGDCCYRYMWGRGVTTEEL
jgi:hypothetical protein